MKLKTLLAAAICFCTVAGAAGWPPGSVREGMDFLYNKSSNASNTAIIASNVALSAYNTSIVASNTAIIASNVALSAYDTSIVASNLAVHSVTGLTVTTAFSTNQFTITNRQASLTLPVVPFSRQVFVDSGGNGQFTNITEALAWVEAKHVAEPTTYYEIVLCNDSYTENLTIGRYTILSGFNCAGRAKVAGTMIVTNTPVYLRKIYIFGNNTDAALVLSNATQTANNLLILEDCGLVETISLDGPAYCIKMTNCPIKMAVRVYGGELYCANSSSGANAKNIIGGIFNCTAGSGIETFGVHLKTSCSGLENTDYLCWITGTGNYFEALGGSWDVFHDAAPKVHCDDSSFAQVACMIFNENYPGGSFVTEGTSTAAPIQLGTVPGTGPATYLSVPDLTINALAQGEVICYITNNIVVQAPLNGTDGRSIKWRFTATNGDWNIVWPTNWFRIPTSSAMVTNNVVSNQTTSIFVTEYLAYTNKWLLQTYIWGY